MSNYYQSPAFYRLEEGWNGTELFMDIQALMTGDSFFFDDLNTNSGAVNSCSANALTTMVQDRADGDTN